MINSKEIKQTFGATVKELRTHKGITQDKLSEHLDMQAQSITTIETGRAFISAEVLAKLCNFFEVEPTIFFRKKVRILSEEDLDYIDKIKCLLPSFSSEKLREIYNILLALKQ